MSQKQLILDYLRRRGEITSLQAIRWWGCTRLAARVSDLRRAGHRIGGYRVTVRTRHGEASVTRYYYQGAR